MFNMNKNLHVSKLWKIDEGAESDIQERAARPSRFPITTLASLRLTESDSSLRSRYEQKGCWRNGRLVQRTIVAPKLSTSCDSNVRSGIEDQSTTSFASSLKYQGNTGDSSGSYDSQYLFQPVDRPTLKSESPTGLLKPEPVVFSKWKKVHQVVQASYQMNELSRHQPFTKNRVQETQRLENSDSQFMFPEAKNGEHSISCNLRKLPNELHRQSPLNMSNVTASFQKHCTIDNDDVSSTGSSSDHTLVGEESQATEDTLTEERLGVIHEDTFSPETVCTARPASTNPVSEEELYYTASQHQRGQLRNTEKDKSTDGISKSTNDVDESCSSYSWHGPSTHEKWGESAVSNSPDMSVCSSLDTEDSQSASSTTSGHAGSNNAPLLHQDHLPSYLDKIPTEPQSRVAHWARIGAYVRECYEKGKICDIRFHVEKETLLAHRAPLCTVSPYFASVFYENDYLNSKPMAEVRLNGITMQSLKVFMDFVYTGKLEIVLPVLLDLVKISDLFEIPEVKQRCVRELDFLPEEDLVMLLVAVREDTGLHFTEPLLHCISDKFLTVCNSQGFLELDVDTLCLILSDDRLLTRTELEVFRAALRWIHHNANLRSQFLETVMATVRFPLMTQSDLFECLDTFSLLGINRQCLDMIYKANWIRTAMALERDDPLHLTIPFPRSRCSHENTNNNVLNTSNDVGSPYKMDISVGSFSRSEEKRSTVVESRNQSNLKSAVSVPLAKEIPESKQESTTTCNQSNQIENHTVVFLDRKLYIIGGMYEQEGESVPRRDVLVYSQEYGWQSLAPMKVARMHHSLCVVDGFIYALGGLGSNNRLLRSVERYDPHTDNWCFVRSMSTPRGGACAAELDGEIWVAGGFGDSAAGSFPILDSVESFNPFTNRWRPRGRLRFGRCNATLSRVGDTLYLSGGLATDRISSRTVIVPDVDVYHAREGRWMLRSRLDEPQHSAASTVSGPLLYLIGGSSVQGKVSVQCLDTRTNEWLSEFPLHSKARWIRSVTSYETSYF